MTHFISLSGMISPSVTELGGAAFLILEEPTEHVHELRILDRPLACLLGGRGGPDVP